MLFKQGVALTGRNTTVTDPPWSVGLSTARAPGGRPALPPAANWRQQTTDADKHQRAKQDWPIRRASNNVTKSLQVNFAQYTT